MNFEVDIDDNGEAFKANVITFYHRSMAVDKHATC